MRQSRRAALGLRAALDLRVALDLRTALISKYLVFGSIFIL